MFASIAASSLFGVLFLLPPLLRPLDGNAVFGWRIVLTLPVVGVLFTVVGRWGDVRAALGRLRARPALVPVLVLDGLLLGVQLWIFGWAPQSGHGLPTALGYLLLPLVMVAIGMVLHRERLSLLRGLAVGFAVAGVSAAVVLAGGLAWSTLLVALGYPLYFTLRRRARLDSTGAMALELAVLAPIALALLTRPGALAPLGHPGLGVGVLLLGLISGTALVAYIAAAQLLPFGLFGLLTYLEPVLLVLVSVTLLGEQLTPAQGLVYGPIVLALALLGTEPFLDRTALHRG